MFLRVHIHPLSKCKISLDGELLDHKLETVSRTYIHNTAKHRIPNYYTIRKRISPACACALLHPGLFSLINEDVRVPTMNNCSIVVKLLVIDVNLKLHIVN